MKLTRTLLVIAAVALTTTACSDVRDKIIAGKRAPDEFAVYSRAPLSLPPDYDLTVPKPGEDRPQKVKPEDIARKVTIGSAVSVANLSPGTADLLKETGADKATPNIRQLVNREASAYAEESNTFVNKLIFWKDTKAGTEIDPKAETKRIQENQALGEPLATDTPIPTIEKKQKGLLEGLF